MTKIKRLNSLLVVPLLGFGLVGCHLNVVSGLTVNGDGSITQTLTYTADQEMEGFIQQRGGMPNMTGWHETENTEDDGNTVYRFSNSVPADAVDSSQFYAIRDNGEMTVSTSGSNIYRTVYHITGTVPSLNQAMQNDREGENVPANKEMMADSFFTVHFTIHTDQGTIQSNGYSDSSGTTATWDLSWTSPTSVDATVASWNMTAVWRTVAAAAIVALLLLGLQAWRRRRSPAKMVTYDSRPLADPNPERGTTPVVFKWQIAASSSLVIVLVVVGLLFWKHRVDVAAQRVQAQAELATLTTQQLRIANLESHFGTEVALQNKKAKDAATASQARAAASDALPLGTYQVDVGSTAANEYETMVAKAKQELNDVNVMYLDVRDERLTLSELAESFAGILGTGAVNSFIATGGQYAQDQDFELNRWSRGITDILDDIKYNGQFTNIEQLYGETEDYASRARTQHAQLTYQMHELDKEVQAHVDRAKSGLVALGGSLSPTTAHTALSSLDATEEPASPSPVAARVPTLAPAVPQVVVCGGAPQYEPSSLHWCTSLCSSYMTGITWQSWGSQSASGVGTLMTNDGNPNCAQGTWIAHPRSVVNLSEPAVTAYCSDSGKATALLFTATDLWGGVSLPGLPCP